MESRLRLRGGAAASGRWRAQPSLIAFVRERFERRLANYENIPDEVRDHYETEIEALAGGYTYRQVLELVQNAADAILEQATPASPAAGRIVLRLAIGSTRRIRERL
jgi:hypothetical protein